jgi:hypothetical protein
VVAYPGAATNAAISGGAANTKSRRARRRKRRFGKHITDDAIEKWLKVPRMRGQLVADI